MQMNLNATQPYPSPTMTSNDNLSTTTTMNASVMRPTAMTTTTMIYEAASTISSSSENHTEVAAAAVAVATTTANMTETMNGEINQFYFYETEQFAMLWILFLMIVLGNSAVLVTLSLSKRKSRMNFFIKQLAFADLSVGLFNVLVDISWRITVSWEAGNLACKVIKFIQCMTTYASTYVLVALSIDRYDAITHPMNFSNCWKRAKLLVLGAWTLSALFSAPQFFLYEEAVIQNVTQCWIDLGEPIYWQLYMSIVSTVLFFIPAIIITLCYAIIVKTIWAKGTYKMPKDKRRTNQMSSSEDEERESRRASSRGIIPRAKVKTVKMTFVIVIVFILCWSPYIVFDLLQVFDKIPHTQTFVAISSLIQSLAPLNSAANPLIYCLFSNESIKTLRRTKLYRWLAKICCCRDIPDESSRRMLRGTRTFTTTSSTVTTSLTSTVNPSASSIHRNGNNRVVNFSNHTPVHFDKNNR